MSDKLKLCGYCYLPPEVEKDHIDGMEVYCVACANPDCSHMPSTAYCTSKDTAIELWEEREIICAIKHPIEVRLGK